MGTPQAIWRPFTAHRAWWRRFLSGSLAIFLFCGAFAQLPASADDDTDEIPVVEPVEPEPVVEYDDEVAGVEATEDVIQSETIEVAGSTEVEPIEANIADSADEPDVETGGAKATPDVILHEESPNVILRGVAGSIDLTVATTPTAEPIGITATAGDSEPIYVASVGTSDYETFAEAWQAVTASGGTLTLLDDIDYEGNLTLPAVNVILDTNGYNLTLANATAGTATLLLSTGASLEVTGAGSLNVKASGTGAARGIFVDGGTLLLSGSATINSESVNDAAISVWSSGTATISSAKSSSTLVAVADAKDAGKLNVETVLGGNPARTGSLGLFAMDYKSEITAGSVVADFRAASAAARGVIRVSGRAESSVHGGVAATGGGQVFLSELTAKGEGDAVFVQGGAVEISSNLIADAGSYQGTDSCIRAEVGSVVVRGDARCGTQPGALTARNGGRVTVYGRYSSGLDAGSDQVFASPSSQDALKGFAIDRPTEIVEGCRSYSDGSSVVRIRAFDLDQLVNSDTGVTYWNISLAFEEAAAGNSLLLMSDVTWDKTVEVKKNVVLDLGDHTLDVRASTGPALYVNDADLDVKFGPAGAFYVLSADPNKPALDVIGGANGGSVTVTSATGDKGSAVWARQGASVTVLEGAASAANAVVANDSDVTVGWVESGSASPDGFALTSALGADVHVLGNVTGESCLHAFTGGTISIDGSVAIDDGSYACFNGTPNVLTKAKSDHDSTSAKTGFVQYSSTAAGETSTIWIKQQSAPTSFTATQIGGSKGGDATTHVELMLSGPDPIQPFKIADVTIKDGTGQAAITGVPTRLKPGIWRIPIAVAVGGTVSISLREFDGGLFWQQPTGAGTVEVFKGAERYPVATHFGTWSGKGNLSARIEVDLQYFEHLEHATAGKLTAGQHHGLSSGSTIITLYESYLKTLDAGEHEFVAHFRDGKSEVINLTIPVAPPPEMCARDGLNHLPAVDVRCGPLTGGDEENIGDNPSSPTTPKLTGAGEQLLTTGNATPTNLAATGPCVIEHTTLAALLVVVGAALLRRRRFAVD